MSCFLRPASWVITCNRCQYELPAQPTAASAFAEAQARGWFMVEDPHYHVCPACLQERVRKLNEEVP